MKTKSLTQLLPELPAEANDELLTALLAFAEAYGDEAVFKMLGALYSEAGRTIGHKARMILARRIVADHGGDRRAAAEHLGYTFATRASTSQTSTNFYRLVDGKTRDGKVLLTDEDPE